MRIHTPFNLLDTEENMVQTKEEKRAYDKAYYESHKEESKASNKAYYNSHKEELKAYRDSHKEESKAYSKAYNELHKEELKDYSKAYTDSHKEEKQVYYDSHKEELKAWSLKHKYNLNIDEYKQMFIDQNNKCKICGEEFRQTPNVDHNHQTGKVRGLLCHNCNLRVGWVENDLLEKTIKYIQEN